MKQSNEFVVSDALFPKISLKCNKLTYKGCMKSVVLDYYRVACFSEVYNCSVDNIDNIACCSLVI